PKEAKEFQYNVTIPYGDDDSDDSDSKDSDSKDSDSKDSDSKDKKDKKKKSKSKKVTVYIDDKTRNIDSVEDSFEIDEDTPSKIKIVKIIYKILNKNITKIKIAILKIPNKKIKKIRRKNLNRKK